MWFVSMPRTGWRKAESDRRLPDLVSVGLLMKVFPAEVVDAVISACGRTEQRRRSLPARSMAYFAMGMALHSDGSYEDVLALISDGLAWAQRDEASGKLANKAAISHARDRLGPEPMAMLFARVAKPLAAEDTPGCWLAGRRLVAIDGTCLDLPDTPANDSHFGRPGVNKGERSAFPQAWVVALADAVPTRYSRRSSAPTQRLRLPCPASYSGGWHRGCSAWLTEGSTASQRGKTFAGQGLTCSGE